MIPHTIHSCYLTDILPAIAIMDSLIMMRLCAVSNRTSNGQSFSLLHSFHWRRRWPTGRCYNDSYTAHNVQTAADQTKNTATPSAVKLGLPCRTHATTSQAIVCNVLPSISSSSLYPLPFPRPYHQCFIAIKLHTVWETLACWSKATAKTRIT